MAGDPAASYASADRLITLRMMLRKTKTMIDRQSGVYTCAKCEYIFPRNCVKK